MSAGAPPHGGWRHQLDSPLARLLALLILLLVLMIPAGMIKGVVQERQEHRSKAEADIVARWGGAQTLIGPVLRVPLVARTADASGWSTEVRDVAYFLPRRLDIKGAARTEMRSRGIFEVPVYDTSVDLSGEFEPPDLSGFGAKPEDLDWSRAELVIALSDPRALQADSTVKWNGRVLELQPSSGQAGAWKPDGVHVALGAAADGREASFAIHLNLRGAGALHFAPAAKQTTAVFTGDWPHPSFQGTWLPAERVINENGFSARWSVSYLGRNYPQAWLDSASSAAALKGSLFGIELRNPVDNYSLADRITKYAILTIVFTFMVIWLTELLSGARAHIIQYGFIGAALCLFGLLQLSFAEHFGFDVAYAVAATAVTILVALYSRSVLGSARKALFIGFIQGSVYGYLYCILKAEDYALLGGSVALFVCLALAMYLTRRLDWSGAQAQSA